MVCSNIPEGKTTGMRYQKLVEVFGCWKLKGTLGQELGLKVLKKRLYFWMNKDDWFWTFIPR